MLFDVIACYMAYGMYKKALDLHFIGCLDFVDKVLSIC